MTQSDLELRMWTDRHGRFGYHPDDRYYQPSLEELNARNEELCRRRGLRALTIPKPSVCNYSYSNPESQGALMNEVNFPNSFDPETTECWDIYTDRVDYGRYREACKHLTHRLEHTSRESLIPFAKTLMDIPVDPFAVRVIHHYNVATGCSCPYIIALWEKPVKKQTSKEKALAILPDAKCRRVTTPLGSFYIVYVGGTAYTTGTNARQAWRKAAEKEACQLVGDSR